MKDSSLTSQKTENTLLGRFEYFAKWFKGAVNANTFYEIGSGLELKQEFSYVEVAPGQGVYTWIDYNHDGIKELNEFVVATFQDQAHYIKVYTPTNQYVKAFTNQFNQLFDINPAIIWKNKKGFKKIISYFSDKVVFSTNRKTNNNDPVMAYNPFIIKTTDTSLVSLNSTFRNTIYINRTGTHFGIDLNYEDTRNKSLLTDGFDTRTLNVKGMRIRWNINKKFMLLLTYNNGEKINNSDFFSNSDFNIFYQEIEPQLSYQPNNSYRITFHYKYSEKENKLDSSAIHEHAVIQKFGADVKYNMLSKASLMAQFDLINIQYNADESTALAYEMLDALKMGMNATWNVTYQRELGNNLQLSIMYNGRQSPGAATVHIGSVQLRAYF